MVRVAAVLLLAFLAGGPATACRNGSSAPGVNRAAVPEEPPSIVGVITRIDGGRVLIEEDPAQSSGSAKAVVRLLEVTRILDRDGRKLSADSLRVGQRVRAWFTGPVAESYPVQTAAAAIVIE